MSKFSTPLDIRNLHLKNRVVMSPISIYAATDGFANDKHFEHYKLYAEGGSAAIIQEATAVSAKGRVSTGDLGIWKDEHVENLTKITGIITNNNCIPGIQLTHAGQKAIYEAEHLNDENGNIKKNNWNEIAAMPLHALPNSYSPHLMTIEDINEIITDFRKAAQRAIKAGYKIIEIHAAHGFLIHQFLSPITNKRKDEYGGSLDNRVRLLLEIVDNISQILHEDSSLWVRIAATDWVDNGWSLNDSITLANMLKSKGVDVIDVISGNTIPYEKEQKKPSNLYIFGSTIKRENNILIGVAGSITDAQQAEDILNREQADIILVGRQLLKDPSFTIIAADELE